MMESIHVLSAGAVLPGLALAGLVAASIPIALLLIRRRAHPMSWGAMRLVQESLSRRAPVRLLRVLLFMVRMFLGPTAAAAMAGVWLSDDHRQDASNPVVILDDTISAWLPDRSGHREFDGHLKQLEELGRSAHQDQLPQVVLLSGRVLETSDVDALSELPPSASGPKWDLALARAQAAIEATAADQILLISAMRKGTLTSLDEIVDEVPITFSTPATSTIDTVRIIGAHAAREVLLPGDPLSDGKVMVKLSRGVGTTSDTSRVRLDLLDQHGELTHQGVTVDVEWAPGEDRRTVALDVPESSKQRMGWAHIHLPDVDSPATHWWLPLHHPPHVQVTLITDAPDAAFDPDLQSSWIKAAIEAGAQGDALGVRSVDYHTLEVDAVDQDLPLVMTDPELLSDRTWAALAQGTGAAPIIILPGVDSDDRWLQTLLQGVGLDTPPRLPVVRAPLDVHQVWLPAAGNRLQLLEGELQGLLELAHVERMIDLQPLVDGGYAQTQLRIDGRPLFVELTASLAPKRPIVVSAISWHPSWSDVPLRSASPALIQELIRSGAGSGISAPLTADGAEETILGPLPDGRLVLPDVEASDPNPADRLLLSSLDELQWRPADAGTTHAGPGPLTATFALAVVILLLIESGLTRSIDHRRIRRRSGEVVSPRTTGGSV